MAELSLSTINQLAGDARAFIEHLGRCGFLDLERDCPRCARPLRLQFNSQHPIDGYYLRCNRCKQWQSIRAESVFEPFRTPLATLARLAVLFVNQTTARNASRILGLNHKVVSSFYDLMRGLMSVDLEFDPIVFDDDVVEIDETLVEALRGGEQGRGRTVGWIFGIVGRDSGQVHVEEVPNREGPTLLAVMQAHVRPNTIVCADTWPGYSALEDDYTLRRINKGRGQMSYWDRGLCINVHTGTIEGVWSQLRAVLHVSHGFPAHYIDRVLSEFIYRKSGRNIYELMKI